MKRYIWGLLLSTVIVNSAFATEGMKVKVGGKLDTQAGFLNQKEPFNRVNSSPSADKLHNFSLVNNTRVKVTAENTTSFGMKYGANIEIFADTSNNANGVASPIGDKVWSFIETKYGRVEAGSVKGAANQMHIYAGTVAKATGGIDGDYSDWTAKKAADGKSHAERFILTPGFPTFCDCKSGANKFVYFSPKYHGLQIGLGYMPDVQMFGTTSKFHSVTRASGAEFENIIEAVAKYEGKYGPYSYGISLAGEKGNAKSGTVDRENLEAWEVGAKVGYANFNLAASYADWGHSGVPVIKNPNAKYGGDQWTLGASYDMGNLGASVTYMQSSRANLFSGSAPASTADHDLQANKLELVSFGVEYKLAEGIMPYAELTAFDMDRKSAVTSNKGEVLLVGTKLKF